MQDGQPRRIHISTDMFPDVKRLAMWREVYGRGITQFEHRHEKVIPRRRFVRRMGRAVLLWCAITLTALVVGMAGYAGFEGMSIVDAYVNAAMILSGMGPVTELKTAVGKIFAGSYALFSGLVIIIATGLVLAPRVQVAA